MKFGKKLRIFVVPFLCIITFNVMVNVSFATDDKNVNMTSSISNTINDTLSANNPSDEQRLKMKEDYQNGVLGTNSGNYTLRNKKSINNDFYIR